MKFFLLIFLVSFSLSSMDQGTWCDWCTSRAVSIIDDVQYKTMREKHEAMEGVRCCHWLFAPFCMLCLYDHVTTLFQLRLHEKDQHVNDVTGCCGSGSWLKVGVEDPACDDGLCCCYWMLCLLRGPCCCCLGRELCKKKSRVTPTDDID